MNSSEIDPPKFSEPHAGHSAMGAAAPKRDQATGDPHAGHHGQPGQHGKHGWMMIACCIPMLAIAIALVATGVVSIGFLFVALACTAMMALMMRGMNHGGGS